MGQFQRGIGELRQGTRIEWDRNKRKFTNGAIGKTNTTGLNASATGMSKTIVELFGSLNTQESGTIAAMVGKMGGNFDTNAEDLADFSGAGLYDSIEEAAQHMVKVRKTIEPNPAKTEAYQYYVDKYIATYPLLKELMHDMLNHETGE